MSQYIWFALCGCIYIIHHEDFLTVYYISVLIYCMCQLLYICNWYCDILELSGLVGMWEFACVRTTAAINRSPGD